MNLHIEHPTDKPNFSVATVGDFTVWFSYRTPIAFRTPETGLVVRENDWGPTTGKHLNEVSADKSRRISGEAFMAQLNKIVISTNA